jgi:hypothetical protein
MSFTPAQQTARTDDMLLADELVQGARPHARGQRGILTRLDFGGRTGGGLALHAEQILIPALHPGKNS